MTREQYLREKIEEQGSLKDFSTKINMPYSTLFSILKNVGGASIDNITKICNGLNITPDYVSDNFSSSNFESQEQTPPRHAKGVRIPVLGKVAAGIPIEAITDVDDWEEIPESMAKTGEYFALRITGNSMEPRMLDGDVVIVKRQSDVDNGDVDVVLVNGNDATVKQITKSEPGLTLIGWNLAAYTPRTYNKKECRELPVSILGKVVEIRGKL